MHARIHTSFSLHLVHTPHLHLVHSSHPQLPPSILRLWGLISGFLSTAGVRRRLLGDFAAEHFQHQRGELHAVLRLEGQ